MPVITSIPTSCRAALRQNGVAVIPKCMPSNLLARVLQWTPHFLNNNNTGKGSVSRVTQGLYTVGRVWPDWVTPFVALCNRSIGEDLSKTKNVPDVRLWVRRPGSCATAPRQDASSCHSKQNKVTFICPIISGQAGPFLEYLKPVSARPINMLLPHAIAYANGKRDDSVHPAIINGFLESGHYKWKGPDTVYMDVIVHTKWAVHRCPKSSSIYTHYALVYSVDVKL